MHPADAATLADIRKKLNYYRRAERAALKRIQSYCRHERVYRKCYSPPMSFNSAVQDYMRYEIVCSDCGKRL